MDEMSGTGDVVEAEKTKLDDLIVAHQAIEPTVGETTAECAAEGLGSVYKISKPHRIIHCSDGIVEEFSDDEDNYEVDAAKIKEPPVDPSTLTWGPWLMYQTQNAGGIVLKACDYLGEGLANFFGITRPKYEYEIEEYKRTIQEEEERQKKEDLEMGGWKESEKSEPQTKEPEPSVPIEETKTKY
ncbi:protein FAM177A1-like isoform X2 [Neocloeon triangulifer]|uniref:protein FAM177A1-like isoform X2 n=1 Tax=Neocloeon triangulifer TaxID=2078957 RepID=UPI00286F330E|nr:protein FAM177A1-like isoform X2 [Neocloeon triangulifer]